MTAWSAWRSSPEKRRDWEAKGNPPCDHPNTAKETYPGGGTGDVGCLVCGTFWPRGTDPPQPGEE